VIQLPVGNAAREISSPEAATFAEDCSVQPSRKTSVGSAAGWAAASAQEKNGTRSRNIFTNVLDEKW
jgi:hypothetical protein